MKRILALFAAILMTAMLFVGCAAKRMDVAEYEVYPTDSLKGEKYDLDASMEKALDTEAEGLSTGVPDPSPRKVILTADFQMQTKDFDKTVAALKEKLAACGGYVQYSEQNGSVEAGTANISLTLRVPRTAYGSFLEFIPTIGNVTHSSEGSEDVTYNYYDTDSRLRVYKAQETRLLELLEQAGNISEMLEIESRLTEIRAQIESMTSVLQRYDDLIEDTTVHVDIWQTRDYTVPTVSFWGELWENIKGSGKGVVTFAKGLLFALIWALPYLLVVGAIVFVVLRLVRRKSGKKTVPSKAPQEKE